MHLVPPLALFMAKSPLVDNFDVSTVQNMVFGAAPLGAGLTQELMNRIGANVIQGTNIFFMLSSVLFHFAWFIDMMILL